MKKILAFIAILFVVVAIVSIFMPTNIQASTGEPEAATELRDPHFNTGDWTTCCNEIPQPCDS